MKHNSKKGLTRRAILEAGILSGAGMALGLAADQTLHPEKESNPEMVRLMTADGKIVEVEKKRIPVLCGNKTAVSNQDLLEWMKTGK